MQNNTNDKFNEQQILEGQIDLNKVMVPANISILNTVQHCGNGTFLSKNEISAPKNNLDVMRDQKRLGISKKDSFTRDKNYKLTTVESFGGISSNFSAAQKVASFSAESNSESNSESNTKSNSKSSDESCSGCNSESSAEGNNEISGEVMSTTIKDNSNMTSVIFSYETVTITKTVGPDIESYTSTHPPIMMQAIRKFSSNINSQSISTSPDSINSFERNRKKSDNRNVPYLDNNFIKDLISAIALIHNDNDADSELKKQEEKNSVSQTSQTINTVSIPYNSVLGSDLNKSSSVLSLEDKLIGSSYAGSTQISNLVDGFNSEIPSSSDELSTIEMIVGKLISNVDDWLPTDNPPSSTPVEKIIS